MDQMPASKAASNLAVEGLNHVFSDVVDAELFEGPPTISEEVPKSKQVIPEVIPVEIKGIPVTEAAERLRTSPRAVIKRLQKGTLKGFKVPSKFGDKWLVDPLGIPEDTQGISSGIPKEIPKESVTDGLEKEIPEGIPEATQDSQEVSPSVPQGVPVEIVQELLRKVEVLTFRNGYLEAQLAEKDHHIKLLTDSQPKPTLWAKIAKWFE